MNTSRLFTSYPLEDYRQHQEEIDAAIRRVLEGGNYVLGPEVEAFEREFAASIGARHCIGLASGTDAIEVMLRALGIGMGAKVAVPSHTAVASAAGIVRAGAEPLFVDIDQDSFTLCPNALEELLASEQGQGVRAVLAVHLYGHPVAWNEVAAVCERHGVLALEDCAQAHGAVIGRRKTGTLGPAAAFSFYPTKNLGAIGDGGAITTSDDALAEKVRHLRQYGWKQRYVSSVEGVNSRLDEVQAAILRVKLRTLDHQITLRESLAEMYARGLEEMEGVCLPQVAKDCRHAHHLYVIQCSQREALKRHLEQAGVPVAIHYPAAVHQQPAYARYAAQSSSLPVTEEVVGRILTLPLHPWLSKEVPEAVCSVVRDYHRGSSAT